MTFVWQPKSVVSGTLGQLGLFSRLFLQPSACGVRPKEWRVVHTLEGNMAVEVCKTEKGITSAKAWRCRLYTTLDKIRAIKQEGRSGSSGLTVGGHNYFKGRQLASFNERRNEYMGLDVAEGPSNTRDLSLRTT